MSLDKLVEIKNSVNLAGGSNTDPVLWDYKFWSDIESLAKKEREKAKQAALSLVKPGTNMTSGNAIVKGTLFRLMFEESKPIMSFDLEKMIETLLRRPAFKKERAFIRQAALDAKVPGDTRKVYRVERRDLDE